MMQSSSSSNPPIEEDEEDKESIQIRIQNMVATVNLGTQLDLLSNQSIVCNLMDNKQDKITQTARNAEYNPKRFQAVIMRIREPRTTALIFASGKMIVTGAKNAEDSVNASKKYVQIVMKVGFPARFSDYKLQNITATCDVGFPIRLEGLIYAHAAYATYEPELFPGLIYRMLVPKIVLLIFVSGKIVLTGAKNTDDLGTAVENIFESLLEFRKRNLIVTAK